MNDYYSELIVFGRNVQFLLERNHLSNIEFEKQTGYSRNDLPALLNGSMNFKLSTAIKIARFFDIYLPSLFHRSFLDDNRQRNKGFEDKDYYKIFRLNILDLRSRGYFGQSDVSMDPATLSRFINGKVQDPKIYTL